MSNRISGAERVGRHVRAVLAEQGRTQLELAAVLGLTHASLSRRVAGRMSFRADELIVLSDYLDVEPSRFFRPIPEPRSREQPQASAAGARGAA